MVLRMGAVPKGGVNSATTPWDARPLSVMMNISLMTPLDKPEGAGTFRWTSALPVQSGFTVYVPV